MESGTLPAGASTRNAGFACFGSPSELLMNLKSETEEQVFDTVEKRIRGLENLKNLLGSDEIGYEAPGSYELFMNEQAEQFEDVRKRLPELNAKFHSLFGFEPYAMEDEIVLQAGFSGMTGAVSIHGEGQIDTGKMMKQLLSLAQSLHIEILNGIYVTHVHSSSSNVTIDSNRGPIGADQIIVATNGFAKSLIDLPDLKPARAQVLITSPIQNLPFRGTYHFDSGYYYFRNVNNRVLFGGGRNLDFATETTTVAELNPTIQAHLEKLLSAKILPDQNFSIEQRWTGIMGLGSSKSAYVTPVSERIFAAVRLGGMGVAIGSLIGKEVGILAASCVRA